MPTTDTDRTGPSLEWCEGCDRPAELCECDTAPNTAPAPIPEQRRPAPEADTEHRTGEGGTEQRTPAEPTDIEAANARRTDGAKQTSPTTQVTARPKSGGGFWRGMGRWISEWGPLLPIWILAGALGAGGFAVSFVTVEKRMEPYFGELAWVVPAATDLGIIVFTLLDIFLARRLQQIPWLRYIPWALTAATIYLNVTAYEVLEAQVAHAVLPSLWVVFSEAIARIMREKAEDEQETTKKVPLIRWVCAPLATFVLWRVMKLWKIATYDEALALEEERQLAKAVMKDSFGSVWKSPRTLKVRYRQRKITVQQVYREAAARGKAVRVEAPEPAPRQSPSRPRSVNGGARNSRPVRPAPAAPVRTDRAPAKGVRSRSANTDQSEADEAVSGERSANDRLAEARAGFQSEGVPNPSVRALAERAGTSPSTAHAFLKALNNNGTA